MLWPTLPGAGAAPAGFTFPWRELPGSASPATAVWPPQPLAARRLQALVEAETVVEPEPASPGRLFDEVEVAQLTAAAAAGAGLEARRAADAETAAREIAMLEELTARLTRERDARRDADRAARHQLSLIAGAVARAFAADERWSGDRALAAVAAMLDGLPEIATARLVVDPPTAAALEARLPELERRAGFEIALQIVAHAGRPPGAIQLHWDGGWAEHDPEGLGQQIATLLAGFAMPQCPTENCDEAIEMHRSEGAAL